MFKLTYEDGKLKIIGSDYGNNIYIDKDKIKLFSDNKKFLLLLYGDLPAGCENFKEREIQNTIINNKQIKIFYDRIPPFEFDYPCWDERDKDKPVFTEGTGYAFVIIEGGYYLN